MDSYLGAASASLDLEKYQGLTPIPLEPTPLDPLCMDLQIPETDMQKAIIIIKTILYCISFLKTI